MNNANKEIDKKDDVVETYKIGGRSVAPIKYKEDLEMAKSMGLEIIWKNKRKFFYVLSELKEFDEQAKKYQIQRQNDRKLFRDAANEAAYSWSGSFFERFE